MENEIRKYKDILAYLFFGICTTVVNFVVYYILARMMNFSTSFSTVTAWFFAVIFAFVTNKIWVFRSKSWKKKIVVEELSSFFVCRVATGVLDLVIMIVTVDILVWNDVVMKMVSNVLVILLNYIASKWIIFKRK